MKELKTYISEGFFSNVGANNRINQAIDAIKDASMNNKINTERKRLDFTKLLASILKDLETNIKKGKFAFKFTSMYEFRYTNEYITRITNDIIISLEISGSNDIKWTYDNIDRGKLEYDAHEIALNIAMDLYYETTHPTRDSKFRHSIANTIEVTEFKVL